MKTESKVKIELANKLLRIKRGEEKELTKEELEMARSLILRCDNYDKICSGPMNAAVAIKFVNEACAKDSSTEKELKRIREEISKELCNC